MDRLAPGLPGQIAQRHVGMGSKSGAGNVTALLPSMVEQTVRGTSAMCKIVMSDPVP